VRVVRRRGWDRLDGCVIASGTKWFAMAVEVDAGFNGFAIARIEDVRGITTASNSRFLKRALALEHNWPLPELTNLSLDTTRAMVHSARRLFPLVTVFYERGHADEWRSSPDFCRRARPGQRAGQRHC